MQADSKQALRYIPAVDKVIADPRLKDAANTMGPAIAKLAATAADKIRNNIMEGKTDIKDPDTIHNAVINETHSLYIQLTSTHYRKVVNATGIILHTGLGRAVLSEHVLDAIRNNLNGYSLLQLDEQSGKRSQRDSRIEQLLQLLTGTEAATVVNNNAAATAIVLNTVAADREVIVSRGQLVEIGGSYRLPDVMRFSGAKLVEVGTTNRTHPRDYEQAITENTAAIMRVHPSNYKIAGFSSEVSLEVMVDIARRNNLTMIDDVGAGSLIDFSQFGFDYEPTLIDSVKAGADIITSSADKLIGASQGGIILGKSEWIKKIRKNQFARILRVGKLTLTAIEQTLLSFINLHKAHEQIPTLQMVRMDISEIQNDAERICSAINSRLDSRGIKKHELEVIDGFSQLGSGSLPTQNMPTKLIAVKAAGMNAEELAYKLRSWHTPIFTRIHDEQVLIDPRTLRQGDALTVVEAVAEILS